ncbi:MAG TPA: type IV pilus assembly protein PilM [candidate division Zixibacteria bacterium]|nr:type IV pilus assembly protein PilM [candidate division Zixibacteria bacterium]MDD4916888.1 type IV pilus assembly protein PilM [candidate division Zixibacteria bacterium]MDM7971476.1 type IV pilus assembly protein PilM [candidate division Zixibacteria bacterium]HOD65333.1 type IV pilus assembly protein PilM [candidate division Zixibacteria bacterium]HOZ07588.1 type IV pilus assembly protein PilM [candidate division Zixibacteria bacterium]
MPFARASKSTVGLDIGASSIKLVKLDHTKSGYAVSAIGIRELPPEAIVADEIRDREAVIFNIQSLIDQTDPKIKNVVISLSGHGVITDRFTIDKKTGAEAEQAILFETEQRAPFDVDDVSLDYHVVKVDDAANKMDVLLVAARKEFLQMQMEMIEDCGLRPVVVDDDALAIYNAYQYNYEVDPSKVTALVNIGADVTNLTYLVDGLYHSTRDVSAGTREIFNAVQKEFRLNPELTSKAIKGEMTDSIDQDMFKATIVSASDELLAGIELAFSYFKSQSRVDTIDWIVLSGGGALTPYLPELLQSKLSIPLEIANPLRKIDYDPELFQYIQPEKIAPLLAVSVGLAMRKVR